MMGWDGMGWDGRRDKSDDAVQDVAAGNILSSK
jgi:hypothetical protein